eukprot:12197871-Alexandrium_andersonii.AAC.1
MHARATAKASTRTRGRARAFKRKAWSTHLKARSPTLGPSSGQLRESKRWNRLRKADRPKPQDNKTKP